MRFVAVSLLSQPLFKPHSWFGDMDWAAFQQNLDSHGFRTFARGKYEAVSLGGLSLPLT